jgi:two-component system OmpR family sensor kinase
MSPTSSNQERLLATLQKLLEIPAADLGTALSHACDALAEATGSDKVDAFLYDESRDSLAALGTSTQPLSQLQRRLGLDVLPLSNKGRVVWVFESGRTYLCGDVQGDAEELRGIKEGMHIESEVGVPLEVAGERRGVIMLASLKPDHFTELDASFTASAARWVGWVARHSELVESIKNNALEQGRTMRAQEIMAIVGHDVRNYLSPVTMRLYSLSKRAQAAGRTADIRDVDAALATLARLSALLSDLLDTARLDAGAFDIALQPIDLAPFARTAAVALSTGEHEIIVKAPAPVVVMGDPARLRQCLDNVLANAVAYSPKGAAVTVSVRAAQHDGQSWGEIEVIDDGPGIPDADLPHVFDRFFSTGGRGAGVGLGLYIAKRIATAHGGDLVADRHPGKGARFTLRLRAVEERGPSADDRQD